MWMRDRMLADEVIPAWIGSWYYRGCEEQLECKLSFLFTTSSLSKIHFALCPSEVIQHKDPFYMLHRRVNPRLLILWNQQQNQWMGFINYRVQMFNYNSIQQTEQKSCIVVKPDFILLLSHFFLYFHFSPLILSFLSFEVDQSYVCLLYKTWWFEICIHWNVLILLDIILIT